MRYFLMILIVSVLCASPTKLQAEENFNSGNYWLDTCTKDDVRDELHCLGFIMGLRKMSQALLSSDLYFKHDSEFVPVQPICSPLGVTNGQMRDIFIAYLKDRPQLRHEPAHVHWIIAMQEFFPCK